MTSRLLPGFPYKNQLSPWFGNSEDACGFSCDAMVRQYTTGVIVSPEQDMDQTVQAGPGYVGYDYADWMVEDLQAHGVVVAERVGLAASDALAASLNNLGMGRPTLVRSLETVGPHYTVLVGQNPGGDLVRANPATGGPEVISQAEWLARYADYLLVVGSPLYRGTLFARYRVQTAQYLRDAPAAASARTYLMQTNWEAVALGPVTSEWVLVVDLTGAHVGWMLRANVVYEGVSGLPSGFTSACGTAQVTSNV